MSIPNDIRRSVISAYRYHCDRSPAESAKLLVAFAIDRGFSKPRKPPPGTALERWATVTKAPLWAVRAAAAWLDSNVTVTDQNERAAVTEVLQRIRGDDGS